MCCNGFILISIQPLSESCSKLMLLQHRKKRWKCQNLCLVRTEEPEEMLFKGVTIMQKKPVCG